MHTNIHSYIVYTYICAYNTRVVVNHAKNTEPFLYDVYENQTQYYLSSVHTAVLLKQKGEKKKPTLN